MLCWLKWGSYLRYVSPTWRIFGIYPVNMGVLWCFPYKLGNSLHGEPQKENSNWCDWLGVRVHYVMKWHSLYQSVSHSVTAVVPEYWLPLRPPPLHTAVALPLGNSHSSPSCLFGPLRSFTSFYLNFTSCPFSVYYFLNSNSGSQSRGEGGKHAKRCGIFLSFLAPMAIRHKALCPFLHAFPPSALSLELPSSTSLWKATLVFPENLFLFSPSSWSFHLSAHACFSPLECLAEAVEVVEPVWELKCQSS